MSIFSQAQGTVSSTGAHRITLVTITPSHPRTSCSCRERSTKRRGRYRLVCTQIRSVASGFRGTLRDEFNAAYREMIDAGVSPACSK
ncbi:hypothetical protein [Pseudomonas sp. NPDC089758]|uniref:hypothetical protein n=1 Tax=Pseudomonas sp. NPDC089758 TaxID=3364473 RepID=UPI00380D3811